MYELLSEDERELLWQQAMVEGIPGSVARYSVMVEDVCFRRLRNMPVAISSYLGDADELEPEPKVSESTFYQGTLGEPYEDPNLENPQPLPTPTTSGKVINLFGRK